MKSLLVISLFFFSMVLIHAQNECTDIIYPNDGESIIFDCCIDEVKNGNVVYFTKNGNAHFVKAIGLSKNGQYIDLNEFVDPPKQEAQVTDPGQAKYSGHNYNYYFAKYKGATSRRNIGIGLTILGTGLTIGGTAILAVESGKVASQQSDARINAGATMYLIGVISVNVGVPLWISGGIKRGNNKRAMDATRNNLSLSAATTGHGIGLMFNF